MVEGLREKGVWWMREFGEEEGSGWGLWGI